jgi:DNA excision repair protein ERCC-4
MQASNIPIMSPFVVKIDQRERDGHRYSFDNLRTDKRLGCRPIQVQTKVCHLRTGDYTLEGFEDQIAIERKGGRDGVADLYSTLGQARLRFQRELYRLSQLQWAAVVVESDWTAILTQPPERSRLLPKTIFRSVLAWSIRFPTVHWFMCPGRAFAEATTYRLLERWWRDSQTKNEVKTNGLPKVEASATACG